MDEKLGLGNLFGTMDFQPPLGPNHFHTRQKKMRASLHQQRRVGSSRREKARIRKMWSRSRLLQQKGYCKEKRRIHESERKKIKIALNFTL
jgi:hypothetical protein